jgi:MoaA/NifB/PqqE/SkfB family radical SAM enzyme
MEQFIVNTCGLQRNRSAVEKFIKLARCKLCWYRFFYISRQIFGSNLLKSMLYKHEVAESPYTPGFFNPLWHWLHFYSLYVWRFVVLKRPLPLIYGIALTDRCNLSCRGCHVSNTGRRDMTWDELIAALQDAWVRGFRELYFSGGEPMLWHDATHTLADVIVEAKRIGYFHAHVYTNGLLGLNIPADFIWISMDGLPGIYERRRGDHFDQVESNIRSGLHSKAAVIYVIDRNTAEGIEPFLRWVKGTNLPVAGVMFYFHTPYYGRDELFLTADERALIIDQLIGCIQTGLPVMNSRAGLLALKSGDWPRRFPVASVIDVDGESVCCRASDEACIDCGYAACTELTEFQRLRPSAVLGMLRYW